MLKSAIRLLANPVVGTITRVNTQQPVVALTFDDGPNPVYTPQILELLDKFSAKATFFMIGENAAKNSTLVEEVARKGHAIGNHSWSHDSFPEISRSQRTNQIKACEEVLSPFGAKIFRPPYGHQTNKTRLDAFLKGYKVIAWDVHVEDWSPKSESWMSEQLIKRVKPGSIVLLHDSIYMSRQEIPQTDRTTAINALDTALSTLSEKYQFITVPEMLSLGKPVYRNWVRP